MTIYKVDGRIRYSEVGQDGRLTIPALIDYFQDCSTFQSEDLEIGVARLKRDHMAWLVNYWQVDILRMPALGDRIRTGTLPYSLKGFMGLRNFFMETEAGEMLVRANSVWSLIDMRRMAPIRIPQEILDKYILGEPLEMEYLPRKIRVPAEGTVPARAHTPEIVREYHLDTNHHVNNCQYIRIAMGVLPEASRIRRFRIMYQRQAHLGDRITPVSYEIEKDTFLVALNAEDGSPYAVVEFSCQGGIS